MNLRDRRWKMTEVYKRALFLELELSGKTEKECVEQAVKELVTTEELRDMYCLYGITLPQLVFDTLKGYQRYKSTLC